MKSKSFGFTLLELLVVVAIIGILATLAVPSYYRYIQRGQFTDATAALSVWSARLESLYLDTRQYGCVLQPPSTDFFSFTCAIPNDGQSYTLTASSSTRIDPKTQIIFSLASNGAKNTKTKGHGSATSQDHANCWLTDIDGSC